MSASNAGDEPTPMCDWRCGRPARHDIVIGPERMNVVLCCVDVEMFLIELAASQLDGVEGIAEFREHHMAVCGYSS